MSVLRRLIPACAGKTRCGCGSTGCGGAHPRVCGENDERRRCCGGHAGSSPRVRGKHDLHEGHGPQRGLIPACAGKTMFADVSAAKSTAHPRVCGENRRAASAARWARGSSPRVRGKPVREVPGFRVLRLIPACAGKTRRSLFKPQSSRAHPRVCGENWCFEHAGETVPGSSPRVRGKPHRPGREDRHSRLIPACAGKTRKSSPASGTAEAHPRVCGENTDYFANGGVEYGSSPRVRGKRPGRGVAPRPDRLIPACAGKTKEA